MSFLNKNVFFYVTATLSLLALIGCNGGHLATGKNLRSLPNYVVTDQHGNKLRFYDDVIAGHAVVLQFMYTRCDGICPAATGNLVSARRICLGQGGSDLRFISISLDPARDTPEDLTEYSRISGMDNEWILLTGKPAEIEEIRKALGAKDPDPVLDSQRSSHSAGIVLGNDKYDRWAMISGLSPGSAIARSILRILTAI